MVSIDPPAETDTTMWIGLDGYGLGIGARAGQEGRRDQRDGRASSVRRFMNGYSW